MMAGEQGRVSRPLHDVRVVELTNFIAGPFCGMLLADLGADVVKVENPQGGDHNRASGPFPPGSPDGAGFLQLNRNKRSIALDIKRREGLDALRALIGKADVLVENFRPGTLDRLGLGYSALSHDLPRLVFLSLSGFGQTGARRDLPGLDLILQAESGIMSVTGVENGPPVKAGVPIVDLCSAIYGAYAVVSALRLRDRTGQGTSIDLALLDAAVSLAVWEASVYWTTGEVPGALGSAHRVNAPYQAFRTADGYVVIGANTPSTWAAFLRVTGLRELDLPEWDTSYKRRERATELASIIERVTVLRPVEHWYQVLNDAGVPCGRLRRFDDVLMDPALRERGMLVDLEHTTLGRVTGLGSPLRMSAVPEIERRAAPLLGQHTDEVLREAGYSPDEVNALIDSGIACSAAS